MEKTMSFDIENVLSDMTSAVSGVISGEWKGVKECVEKALKEEKAALSEIAKARLNGEIDDEDVKEQLVDEKVALEAALLVCKVKTKVMAQNAANAAIDVFNKAIEMAL